MNIGEKIKKLRKDMGFSLSDLASTANIGKTTLFSIESDNNFNPTIASLKSIADALCVDMGYLVDDARCFNHQSRILHKLNKLSLKDRARIEKIIDLWLVKE